MRLFKKTVDERQELELMRVERAGFWVFFFGLVVSIILKTFIDPYNISSVLSDGLLLIIGGAVVVVGCLRKGLWSYHGNPSPKTNIIYSLISSAAVGIISLIRFMQTGNFNGRPLLLLCSAGISAAFTFLLCFALLSFSSYITNRRRKKLEDEISQNEDDI